MRSSADRCRPLRSLHRARQAATPAATVEAPMRIATWNVNGFRARQAQFAEWLARDRPDVVCLQELKAERTQIPELPGLADYDTYWHGLRAYSGVALHVRK